MISIINYGVGNVRAFLNIYDKLGYEAQLLDHPNQFKSTTKLILPGVGHFDYAMLKFKEFPLYSAICDHVLNNQMPILGICVGMQMMARGSEEGKEKGLGWIDADILKFDKNKIPYKPHTPHMGWNDVIIRKKNKLLNGFPTISNFYFLHSYYISCDDNSQIVATSEYGINFTSIVNNKNIYGVQFHPEKRHHFGIKLLENFSKI